MPNATPSLDTVFCEAVGIADADARAAYLARACGGDAGLRRRLEAIRLQPDFAEVHCNLGHVLREQGHYPEALAAPRRGHEVGSRNPGWRYPSARWVQECEALAKAAEKHRPPAPKEIAPPPRPRD